MAWHHLKQERPNHTLSPTDLVHEVYFQLRIQHSLNLNDRNYFLSLASTMMRRVLVNYAKRRQRKKRVDDTLNLFALNGQTFIRFEQGIFDLIELENALQELGENDPRQMKIVEMHFYGGLTYEEIAEVLKISLRTVMREWRFAKTWLYRKLKRTIKDDFLSKYP